MFHVDNGAGRFTAVYDTGIPGHLCDGKWHKVVAKKIKHRVELTVDGNQVEAQSPNPASTSADTNDPVFVGGFPGQCRLPQQEFPCSVVWVGLNTHTTEHSHNRMFYKYIQECVPKYTCFLALESTPITNTLADISSV